MKFIYFLILLSTSLLSFSQVQVRGYYRKDGTYVRPHVRTAPNSTITDNYSYQGNYNPNLEYNTPLPKSNSNYHNSYSSTTTSGKDWVNGYYRRDGTYVSGYYRNKKNSSSSYNNPYSNSNSYSSPNINSNSSKYYNSNNYLPTIKYVNTTKVNFRTTPDLSNNIIRELEYNDEVTSISTIGYWDKVQIKRYNTENYSYVTFEGYINSRYLSTYSQSNIENYNFETNNNSTNSKNFRVVSNKAYFHSTPDVKNKKNAYLIYGEEVYGIAESKYFIYIEFINSTGIKTVGWILKDDLIRY